MRKGVPVLGLKGGVAPPPAQFHQHVVEALTGTTPGDFDLVKLNWRHPMLFFEIMMKNTLCYCKRHVWERLTWSR